MTNTKGMTMAQMQALLAQRERELEEAKAKANARLTLTCKVSEKGALSLYGLGRFPVTLYGQQWERLISHIPAIKQFMAENAHRLITKEESQARAAMAAQAIG